MIPDARGRSLTRQSTSGIWFHAHTDFLVGGGVLRSYRGGVGAGLWCVVDGMMSCLLSWG